MCRQFMNPFIIAPVGSKIRVWRSCIYDVINVQSSSSITIIEIPSIIISRAPPTELVLALDVVWKGCKSSQPQNLNSNLNLNSKLRKNLFHKKPRFEIFRPSNGTIKVLRKNWNGASVQIIVGRKWEDSEENELYIVIGNLNCVVHYGKNTIEKRKRSRRNEENFLYALGVEHCCEFNVGGKRTAANLQFIIVMSYNINYYLVHSGSDQYIIQSEAKAWQKPHPESICGYVVWRKVHSFSSLDSFGNVISISSSNTWDQPKNQQSCHYNLSLYASVFFFVFSLLSSHLETSTMLVDKNNYNRR